MTKKFEEPIKRNVAKSDFLALYEELSRLNEAKNRIIVDPDYNERPSLDGYVIEQQDNFGEGSILVEDNGMGGLGDQDTSSFERFDTEESAKEFCSRGAQTGDHTEGKNANKTGLRVYYEDDTKPRSQGDGADIKVKALYFHKSGWGELEEGLTTKKLTEARRDIGDYKDDLDALQEIPTHEYEAQGLNKQEFIANRKRIIASKKAAKNIVKSDVNAVVYKPVLGVSANNKKTASNKFGEDSKTNTMDIDNFHIAYDEDLQKLNLLGLFNKEGFLKSKGTYGAIKQVSNLEFIDRNPASIAVKALKKLGVISYTGNNKVYSGKKDAGKVNNTTGDQEVSNQLKASNGISWKSKTLTNLYCLYDKASQELTVYGELDNNANYQYSLLIKDIDANTLSPAEAIDLILERINAGEGKYIFAAD